MYHQKIPDVLPELGDLKPTHGLAKPDPYTIVEKRWFFDLWRHFFSIFSPRWNEELLAGFDLSQKSKKEETKEKVKENREKIPEIKKPDIKIIKGLG